MEGIMEATNLAHCPCTIVDETIHFCALHARAASLLEACRYVRKYMTTLKAARADDQDFIRELIIPYLDNVIGAIDTNGA